MSHQQLDARRLLCPMPVIKTQNQVVQMQPGDELEVICTDPGALNDIPAWARINGHSVIQTVQSEDEIRITVRVGA
ncbi:sulfurtransferase TusA family protein [Methylophaga sp.]|uniref:sulfurtransferase TusA family protein n=1 Tax=Methylophaga sp. TaxID=2024840 RepID=UPI0014002BF7|nr:sulfurtransferase TusA family protein [Methylophaga sp.]MTI62603.1 sulfurtransferase TusA family protein [Methylophaga sp.]